MWTKKLDINHVIDEVVLGLRTELFHKNIAVRKHLKENLPQVIDLGVSSIITNLLRNSIDAITEDGKIEIQTETASSAIIIQVEDSGCGIPEGSEEKIFEPFYTTKDIDKGCGLGLTIVSEIVKSYNGKIEVESKPKKGTKFSITIPIQSEYVEISSS